MVPVPAHDTAVEDVDSIALTCERAVASTEYGAPVLSDSTLFIAR